MSDPNRYPKILIKQLLDIIDKPIEGAHVVVDPDDRLHWFVFLTAPKGCPYEGGRFRLSFDFHDQYPFKPPKIIFETKIYHPLFPKDGNCNCLFRDDWSPIKSMKVIIEYLLENLGNPRGSYYMDKEIADEINENRELFLKKARQWTKDFAL